MTGDDTVAQGESSLEPLANFQPIGPSTAGLFDVKKAAQILFLTRVHASVPKFSRARTILYHHALGRAFEIASAEIGDGLDTSFAFTTAGSLRLDPGRYSWFSELNPVPFDQVGPYSLRATAAASPDPIETKGLREVTSAMSGPAGTDVFARGFVDAQVGDTERFSAQVVVTNLMTNQQFATPLLQGIGPTDGEVEIGVVPYVLAAGQIFSARFKVNYAGSGAVRCRLQNAYA